MRDVEGIIEVSGADSCVPVCTRLHVCACTLTTVEERGRGTVAEENVDGDMRGHSFEAAERGWPTHTYANHIRRCTGF